VVAAKEAEGGPELDLCEPDPQRGIADERMHLPAFREGLALDPAENVPAGLVGSKPARSAFEAGLLETNEDVSHQLGARGRRPADGVAQANDGVMSRPTVEPELVVSRG